MSNKCSAPSSIKRQHGFSINGYLASVVVAGLISTALLPTIHGVVDTADYNALAHARSTLESSLRINIPLANHVNKGVLKIEGQPIKLKHGYPAAEAENLKKMVELDKFPIEEFAGGVRIWSPGGLFCMTYNEPKATKGPNAKPLVSPIKTADKEGACA